MRAEDHSAAGSSPGLQNGPADGSDGAEACLRSVGEVLAGSAPAPSDANPVKISSCARCGAQNIEFSSSNASPAWSQPSARADLRTADAPRGRSERWQAGSDACARFRPGPSASLLVSICDPEDGHWTGSPSWTKRQTRRTVTAGKKRRRPSVRKARKRLRLCHAQAQDGTCRAAPAVPARETLPQVFSPRSCERASAARRGSPPRHQRRDERSLVEPSESRGRAISASRCAANVSGASMSVQTRILANGRIPPSRGRAESLQNLSASSVTLQAR